MQWLWKHPYVSIPITVDLHLNSYNQRRRRRRQSQRQRHKVFGLFPCPCDEGFLACCHALLTRVCSHTRANTCNWSCHISWPYFRYGRFTLQRSILPMYNCPIGDYRCRVWGGGGGGCFSVHQYELSWDFDAWIQLHTLSPVALWPLHMHTACVSPVPIWNFTLALKKARGSSNFLSNISLQRRQALYLIQL